jgi:hypothetical protein
MTDRTEGSSWGQPARLAPGGIPLPFCGHEYPPLQGSPGTVVCTRPAHPRTELHQNEETGWFWPAE